VAVGGPFPTTWSHDQHIVWKVALPGQSGSTPAVWGDNLFLTYNDENANHVVCLDRNGKERWAAKLAGSREGKHKKASGSNPSPTTDGQHVFVYFKSGDLACFDFDGQQIWHKNLQELYGEDTLWWDLGTSPVLTRDLLVVACMHSGPSYLAGFEKATGELVWKQDRELGAPSEAAQSYTTPIVVTEGGRETIVVLGADHVTGHDAATGKQLWQVGSLNPSANGYFRSISSPVVSDDLVIAPYARGTTLTAIRLGGSGDVTDTHVVWEKKGTSADVPTPAAADGRVYICGDKGQVTCLDAQTGDVLWEHQLEKNRNAYSSSPVFADGKLYVTREDGTTFVLAAGEKPEVIARNELGEFTVATPVLVDGRIYLRTSEHLYCIGE
jgi:outer membrane protein assembly factor BamB